MNKNIIIIYHIPVDDMSSNRANEILTDALEILADDTFYKVWILPYTGGDPKKVIIETIDLKNIQNKKEVEKSIEDVSDKLLKYFEHEKWKRIQKLKKIIGF